jgi:hypothetical protein
MPYAVLQKEIEQLDESQQDTVVMFIRFLLSQKNASAKSFVFDNGQAEELIAQAIEDSLTIVTRDRIIPQHQVPTIW